MPRITLIVMLVLLVTLSGAHALAHLCNHDWLIMTWGLETPSWWSTAGVLVITATVALVLVLNRRRS